MGSSGETAIYPLLPRRGVLKFPPLFSQCPTNGRFGPKQILIWLDRHGNEPRISFHYSPDIGEITIHIQIAKSNFTFALGVMLNDFRHEKVRRLARAGIVEWPSYDDREILRNKLRRFLLWRACCGVVCRRR